MLDDIFRMKARSMRGLSSDDILAALGLERRHTALDDALPTGLAFVAGLAAGAGIALLLAPKSGREMRQDLSSRASELTNRIGASANELANEARSAIGMGTSGTAETRAPETTQRSLAGTNRTS
jgi:hypothetical protein